MTVTVWNYTRTEVSQLNRVQVRMYRRTQLHIAYTTSRNVVMDFIY